MAIIDTKKHKKIITNHSPYANWENLDVEVIPKRKPSPTLRFMDLFKVMKKMTHGDSVVYPTHLSRWSFFKIMWSEFYLFFPKDDPMNDIRFIKVEEAPGGVRVWYLNARTIKKKEKKIVTTELPSEDQEYYVIYKDSFQWTNSHVLKLKS